MAHKCEKCGSEKHTDHSMFQRNLDKARLPGGGNPKYEHDKGIKSEALRKKKYD
jgi:hypothetical protein